MKKISLVYFGTPDFSARFLEKLITDQSINRLVTIKLVVTQPDKPVGRKQILTPSPVKLTAKKYGIPVLSSQFSVVSGDQKDNRLITDNRLLNTDSALLFAYGEIIPAPILKIPKYGFWNIHPSLLPKYRGASPIAYPLILGDKKTGVTIIKMDEKLDHGPIIAQQELEVLPTDRRSDLEIKLTDLAFDLFKKIILYQYGQGSALSLQLKPQNHSQATYTRLLKKDDGFILLSALKKTLNNEPLNFEELPIIIKEYLEEYPSQKECFLKRTFNFSLSRLQRLMRSICGQVTFNLFRGLYPWPGIWTMIEPPRLKNSTEKPRRLNKTDLRRLKITDLELVENKLIIKKVQLEGKKEVEFKQFNEVYQIF